MKTYPTAERLRELFSYDKETNSLCYAYEPYHKPHLLGRRAGHTDTRDGIYYVNVDGKAYVAKNLIAIHQTGALPAPAPHHTQWTQEFLRTLVGYDQETGIFIRLHSAGSSKVGDRADYVESNGYRYVILKGKRFIAARLAWFYVNGEWPKRVLRFQDGNEQNCAIGNLAYGEWDTSTPEGRAAYDKSHRQRNPEWHRKFNLKRDFGISLEQYQALFVEQGGVCGCCNQPETSVRDGKRKWLAVDHDHADNTIRGLLCSRCNQMIGYAKDNIETLRAGAAYLEAHAAKPKTNVIPLAARRNGQS